MRTIRFLVLTAAILAVVVLIAGCPGNKNSNTKITIGAVLPLTGEVSYLGEGDQKALALFAEKNPDVRFAFEDSKGTPKDGLSAVNKLAGEQVKYYITSLSYVVNTVQPTIDKQKALNFTLSMDARSEEKSRYCMRLYVTFQDEMDRLVELAQSKKANRVAVLYVNVESMNNAVQNYLRKRLQQAGIELVTETYDIGTKDFRQQLVKLSSKRPQIIRIIDFGDKMPTILKQISETRTFANSTIVMGMEILVSPYAQFARDITDRLVFTAPKVLLDKSNPVVNAYRKKYGSAPNFDAMFCYDIAGLLVPVIRKHGYDNVDAVIDEISRMKRYKGVAADYAINKHGGVSPEIFWGRVQNGKLVFQALGHED